MANTKSVRIEKILNLKNFYFLKLNIIQREMNH